MADEDTLTKHHHPPWYVYALVAGMAGGGGGFLGAFADPAKVDPSRNPIVTVVEQRMTAVEQRMEKRDDQIQKLIERNYQCSAALENLTAEVRRLQAR
jgi:hypothetical protein